MSAATAQHKEPLFEQISSFVGFFILLLVFKTFFLPLFIIPTGSMAETLCGRHATYTCPNCGYEYEIQMLDPGSRPYFPPAAVECPNCRYRPELSVRALERTLRASVGDRITVLGWPHELGIKSLELQRWDVVVFKNPQDPEVNFIKRLIGLPNDVIELIDGDVFANGEIARKPHYVQENLWFPYYNNDYIPIKPGGAHGEFHPQWVARDDDGAWSGLDTRVPRFDGLDQQLTGIQFVTDPDGMLKPGTIQDIYGYNPLYSPDLTGEPRRSLPFETVTDVRLSCEVRLEGGEGFIELSTTKYGDRFIVRLHADGHLELDREDLAGWQRETLATCTGLDVDRPLNLSLGNADYLVTVAVNGKAMLETSPEQYSITPDQARQRSTSKTAPVVRIGAERVSATLAHLRIDRDIYYKCDPGLVRLEERVATARGVSSVDRGPGRATQGHPLTIGSAEYFVMGDNSPGSQDGRLWTKRGPHMRSERYRAVPLGTVPADQMMGRAFFVYWPGFLPLPFDGPALVPNLGRVRWIY
ncbi:MAG: hypothetical protein JXO22_17940 [Phycisphaerae bacterium]|nr:hypothetical protein [Phycisphaerae bacterium]